MKSLPTSFLRRVRIHGGEFDASARAMHRKAALEIVLSATIERIQMSTKTKFKRVALVAVAAMGIGLLTAVPSNAAPSVAYTTMYDTTNGYQVVGGQATVTLSVDTSTVTNVVVSGVGSVVSTGAPTNATVNGGTAAISSPGSSFTVTGNSSGATKTVTIVLASSTTGTQTITATPLDNNGVPGTAVTKTITWVASTTLAVSATNSTSFLGGTNVVATSDQTVTVAKSAAGQVGNVAVTLKDTNGNALYSQTLTATVSGPGLIALSTSVTGSGTARAASLTLSSSNNVAYVLVSADGTAGVSTITISDGSTVISTETVTFTGGPATFVATASATNLKVGANGVNGTAGSGAIKVKVTDSNGNIVADGTSVYASSSSTATATVTTTALTTVSGYVYYAVQGLAAGTSVITFGDAATPTVSTTITVTVTAVVASTVTLAFDKASYTPGEKMVLTLTAKDSTGAGIADTGTYTAFLAAGGLISNVSLQGDTISGTAPTFVGGVATFTLYAPLAAGTINITGTTGVSANLATAVQSLALAASAEVTNPSADAATDAANAATDAANYAADAADAATTAAQEATAAAVAAQESADAATAAVVALGLRVDTLLASVRAQLTSLSNLLVRIIKKTKA
ncbi:MAG: hypothetical protein HY050_06715 [Actinobacteria bacterium]|nr:hypothetical protein [Actinomycetota bacterium]